MRDFSYAQATSRADAIALAGLPDTMVLAGGTELLNWTRIGVVEPARIVDITRISGMEGVEALPTGGVRIGALTKLNDAAQPRSSVPPIRSFRRRSSNPPRRRSEIWRLSAAIRCSACAVPISAPTSRPRATSASRAPAAPRYTASTKNMRFSAGPRIASPSIRPIRPSRWQH
jgi:hypothetical protein